MARAWAAASGVLNTTRQVGGAIGVALLGSLIAGPGHLVPGLHLGLEVIAVAFALAAGRPTPEPRELNRLAMEAVGHPRLEPDGKGLPRATTAWSYPTTPAELAHRLIEELGHIDPFRLRECERAECSQVFYDITRPSTQRWHAEDPCGWLERQRRHRNQGR